MAANNPEEEDVDFNEESELRDNVSEGADNENIGGEERPSSPAEEGENVDDNASASDNNENSSAVGKKRVREASKESQSGDGNDTEPKQKKLGALATSRSHTSKKSSLGYGSSNGTAENDRKAHKKNLESKSKDERDSDRIQNVLFVSRYGHTKPINENDIEDIFRPYGSFLRVTMKGAIAFVDFENAADAVRAKKELHQTPALNSDSIIVDFKKRGEGRSDKNASSFRERDRDGFKDGPYRKPYDSYGSHFDDTNNHRSSGRDFPRDGRDSDRRSGHYDNRRDNDYEPKYDDRGSYSRYNGPGGGKHNDSVRNHRPPYEDRDYPPHQRAPIPKGFPPPVNAYHPPNNRNNPRDEYPPYDSGTNHRNAPYGAHPSGRAPPGRGPPPAGDYQRSFDGNTSRSKDRPDGFGYGPSRQGGPPPYSDSRPPARGGGEGGYPPDHGYGGGGYKAPYDDHRRFGPSSNKFDGYQGEPYRGGGGGGGGRGSGF